MPVPENLDPGPSPGLFSNLRSFWGVLVAILHTRLDLATIEIEESGAYVVRLIIVSLAALLVVIMTIFFFFLFLIVIFWAHRVLVLGIVFVASLLAAAILVFSAFRMVRERPRFLAQTLAELRRDAEGLRPAPTAPKTGEVKP